MLTLHFSPTFYQLILFSKTYLNGPKAHPLFKYLKQTAPFQGFEKNNPMDKMMKMMIGDRYPEYLAGDEIKWNFTKFLINQTGNVVNRFEPSESPFDFEAEIQKVLQ